MKIKVIEVGRTAFDADAEYCEPEIRKALGAGGDAVRSAVMDTTDTERDTDSDEYITITEDDGTVLWSGWLTGARDKPAPAGGHSADALLALPLPENDLGASTVREALSEVLAVAWRDGGNWSPTGNSDWQHILYHAMTDAGLARIGYDEDGYATESGTAPSYAEANALIAAAIERLGQ